MREGICSRNMAHVHVKIKGEKSLQVYDGVNLCTKILIKIIWKDIRKERTCQVLFSCSGNLVLET